MAEINLIQITQKLPPSLHGIGDYACKLASKLKLKYAIDSIFVNLDDIEEETSEALNNSSVYSLSKMKVKLADILIKVLELHPEKENILILHYDRGFYDTYLNKKEFEKYYLPINLLKNLSTLKNQGLKFNLIIVFHEFLFPVIERRRDYLLRPFQNLMMKKLIHNADIAVCSNPVVAKQIFNLNHKTKILISPVFSNIGEPSYYPFEIKQEGVWVIFGSTDNLITTLRQFIYQLHLIKKHQHINVLNVLGGRQNDEVLNLISEIKKHIYQVKYFPGIDNAEASNIFKVSRFCYMYYFSRNLLENSSLIFKSGVFSTACSHGVIPVFGNEGMEYAISVFEHPGFICFQNQDFNFPDCQEINALSSNIFNWYQKYSSLEYAASTFSHAIEYLGSQVVLNISSL
ncbi:hypothetical protein LC613_32435 [Nostoc sphaeroides CHAB 2801]|uniref:hypothetical protein n=1 Tax=Nostoc sphaeroides TaxID=446679 RepID=UPI001E41BF7E|nr:hypothetical protein [Nostoc sphaeroides]MCC5632346.1 hypothetical protein [Nostoc sphaeroides CHAB 2801]